MSDSLEPTRGLQGEILDPIVIEIRPYGSSEKWCVFAVDPRSPIEELPLSQHGRMLGGTFDEAIADAERVAREMSFVFLRPSGLWMPSPSSKHSLILPPGARS